MYTLRNLLLLLSITSLIFACGKDDDPEPEEAVAPEVNFSSPAAFSEYETNDTIFIKGTVTDKNEDLTHVHVHMVYTDKEDVLLHLMPGIENSTAVVDTFVVVKDNTSEHYLLKVETMDEAGNHTNVDIKVSINHHH